MVKKPIETTEQSTEIAKVPQPHGGALNSRGTPGNKGGGRPPDEFRKLIRKTIAKRKLVTRLADIAEAKIGQMELKDGVTYTETPIREQRGAIEALFKYGIGEERGVKASVVRANLEATIHAIEQLPPEHAGPLLKQLASIWGEK